MDRHLLPEEIHQLIDGEPGLDTAPLEAHLRECVVCRTELAWEQQMVEALAQVPPLAPSTAFADHITGEVYVHVPWSVAAHDTAERVVGRMTPRSRGARVLMGVWVLIVLALSTAACVWLLGHARRLVYATRLVARPQAVAVTSPANAIDLLRHDPGSGALPPADSFTVGPRVVAAGTEAKGNVAIRDGNLDVFGTIDGNAVVVHGNLVLHPGAHVHGNAFAGLGQVALEGGIVDGEIRSLSGAIAPGLSGLRPHSGAWVQAAFTWRLIKLTLAWLAFSVMMGLGVLTFVDEPLTGVTEVLERRPGFAFWTGVLGELSVLPVMVISATILALTIVGALLAPLAIIAIAIVTLGAHVLGAAAVAERTGRWFTRDSTQRRLTPRGAQLRAIVTGIAAYGALWIVFALLGSSNSPASLVVRGFVVAVTAVALMFGFGAVLAWRIEERQRVRGVRFTTPPSAVTDVGWQTPTPISGVAAARLPSRPSSSGSTP